jgi:antitoxin component of RelBE/YafQ-DinJ toxin-antitoxin module
MDKKKKANVHLKIDSEVWDQALVVIEEMGFTQSGFVEMMIRRFVQAETVPMGQVIGEVLQDVLNARIEKKKGKK